MSLIKTLSKNKKLYKFFVKKTFNQLKYSDVPTEESIFYYTMSKKLKPKNKQNHVGIEIECYSRWNKDLVYLLLIENKLDKKVSITYDGSLEESRGFELRVIDTERNIDNTLNKLQKVLKRIKAYTLEDCGLHVHLDMRQRDYRECFKKLVNSQEILTSFVHSDRLTNDYCKKTELTDINSEDRYKAINWTSYKTHKTIEVRLHEGTTDMGRVSNWVKLLTNIINNDTQKYDIKKVKSKKLKNYINKNLKEGTNHVNDIF